ncbi:MULTISPECIES: NADH-quinone oxidoreductase subunit H [Rhodopseudomonas]|uniref:Hydrogenase 3 membrane subunit n=1 Tax=Rhodopseudomonas palustris TaxID=1076 RepID=A0A0D7EQU9_RHOPL|nr:MULTISPECIES: NADH-quinone oxidoreductase subunit H [Rhodopseudomonas]KIZ43173.1 hydrogenase 3 membrane subunit [Rhodopseudomonas palustris]MDF3811860.1 NADH-quinone oxidoreductase subunit H [Rhodopseudomonas sp. BAL398]WOK19742.1 NADH-quinone oxidoreductase subunit H [Rhodopseudomonas sp. BAL398]
MPTLTQFLLALVQALLLLAAAPLFTGLTRMLRCKMHTRQGPGVLQDYRDILKLLRRQNLQPPAAGFAFRIMPAVMIATLLTIAMALPVLTRTTPIPGFGDIITVIYLFALVRFFFSLAGLDSGSSFAGIGGSRELTLGVLVEPTLVLSLLVTALLVGTSDIGAMGTAISVGHIGEIGAVVISGVACAFACYFELGKLPYDMAEAEQELQEGPLTEYSGPSLALLKIALGMKQLLILAFVFAIFIPFGSAADTSPLGLALGAAAFVVKVGVICMLLGVIENSVARARFRLTPRHSWFGLGIASLGFVFYLVGM